MQTKDIETILIAAPGSGIGREITKNLLEDGYRILGIGGEMSRKYSESLKEENYLIDFIKCDYNSESSIVNAFEKAKTIVKKITGMINFVGGSLMSKAIQDISLEDFRKVLNLNLDSAFVIARETYKWMKVKGGGNIVFFGSTTGFKPSNKKLPYGVAKAGVHAMTWFFAHEGSQYNVVTNTISPGYVMTERHIEEIEIKAKSEKISFDNLIQKYREKNPLKRVLYPKEIYPLVKLLLTTNHMQGQIFKIDSGQILG
ncbi:MAG: SDR family oxidoreductase [Candidatus Heimdallarchaeota archaeon]|nr:SDR family oxidoreductase [Candidatus Heimdallarchaeota archaeon]MCK4770257.1 SDR family oxidoreductase [Candidatus Heimdallarchaeota archaeon]